MFIDRLVPFWFLLVVSWSLTKQELIVHSHSMEIFRKSGIWTMGTVFSLSKKDSLQSLLTLYLFLLVWFLVIVIFNTDQLLGVFHYAAPQAVGWNIVSQLEMGRGNSLNRLCYRKRKSLLTIPPFKYLECRFFAFHSFLSVEMFFIVSVEATREQHIFQECSVINVTDKPTSRWSIR